MNQKKLMILTIVLAAIAVLVLAYDRLKSFKTDNLIGQSVVSQDLVAKVKKIAITKGDKTLTLESNDKDYWFIQGQPPFPVDANRLARELDRLTKIKFQQFVTDNKNAYEQYGLNTPISVSLSSQDQALTTFVIGGGRPSGGQYVTLSGSDKVFLIGENISWGTDEDEWQLKQLLNLKKEDIKSMSYFSVDNQTPSFSFKREKSDQEWSLDGIKCHKKLKQDFVNNALSPFLTVRYSSRVDLSNEQAKLAATLKYPKVRLDLFDHRNYIIGVSEAEVGKDQRKYFLKVIAEGGSVSGDQLQAIEQLNSIMRQWAFEVSNGLYSEVKKTIHDFVEQEVGKAKKTAKNDSGC